MKARLLLPALILFSATLLAQKEIINHASSMMHEGEYDLAERYLDSIIKVSPNTVDAIMMKGNVILNKAFKDQSIVSLESEHDESIYDQTIGTIGENPRSVDKETARKTEVLWLKCIKIDPKRLDIHQGLCTLYGMALMKDELQKELPELIKNSPDKSESLAYSLADYAQDFAQRKDLDGCMEIYKTIQSLFPESGGLAGDIAVMYQKNGKIKESVEYARKAAAMKGNDFMTYYNVASLLAYGSDITEGKRVFTEAQDVSPLFIYYRGIIQFCEDDPAWRSTLKSFLNKYKTKDKEDGRILLAKVMTENSFKLDSAGYAGVMDAVPFEFEYLLISTKAQKSLSNKYDPTIKTASLYAQKSCYDKAVLTLKAMEAIPKTARQDSSYHFQLGYAQYKSGLIAESATSWKMLTNAGSFFRQSAACYFLGQIYKSQGKTAEARALFKQVADHPSESKFANFCSWELH